MGYDYDLFVIGAGSGGLATAQAAVTYGKKVGICDFVKPSPAGTTWGVGGTCVNVGCIPKKLFHASALAREAHADAHSLGWDIAASHNWETMVTQVNNYIRSLNWGYKTTLRSKNIKLYTAHGSFKDEHTVLLDDGKGNIETVTAEHILIATGGRPSYGDYPGALECCISSDDIFWMKKAPGKTLVIGASYIALECAGFLTGLGFDTTVMVRSILLRGFDQDFAEKIGQYMEAQGTKFVKKATPTSFEKLASGKILVHATGVPGFPQEFDTVLMAVGRKGLAGDISLENTSVKFNARNGKIPADEFDATNVPNIHVVGDMNSTAGIELTPVAIAAGRKLAARLFGGSKEPMDYTNVATTVFTPLEFGTVGLSEEDAKEMYGSERIKTYHAKFKPLEWALNKERNDDGYIKVVCDMAENEKVLGVHILGPNAGEMIQGFAVAVKVGFTKSQLDETVGIHPTVAEEITGVSTEKRAGEELAAKANC